MAETEKRPDISLSDSTKYSGLTEAEVDLCEAAQLYSKNAYAPYSSFHVGAAVRTADGSIYGGANLENASYGLSICAEVAALTAANSATSHQIVAIAILGRSTMEGAEMNEPVYPCGRCRQMIHEASVRSGVDISILACNGNLTHVAKTSISKLLPNPFGPEAPLLPSEVGSKAASLVEIMQSSLEDRAETFLSQEEPKAGREHLTGEVDEKMEDLLDSISTKFRKPAP